VNGKNSFVAKKKALSVPEIKISDIDPERTYLSLARIGSLTAATT